MKSINLIKRGIAYGKSHGAGRMARKALEHGMRLEAESGYESWLSAHLMSGKALEQQRRAGRGGELKFSVLVPVYRTSEPFLRAMLESVLNQTYENLELCLADGSGEDDSCREIIETYVRKDPRIRYEKLAQNGGIAGNTNAALFMAEGDYICLLDHDDLLAENALYELFRMLQLHPDMDVVYTDEDKVDFEGKRHFQPHFKPDFNLELLRSNNYICHLFCVKRTLALETGGFRKACDGAQDYDFILRCTEGAGKIGHVPKILYHWRCHTASTAANPESKTYAYEAGKKAVEDHLSRCGIAGKVECTANPGFYRVHYALTAHPHVTVLTEGNFSREEVQLRARQLRISSAYSDLELWTGTAAALARRLKEKWKDGPGDGFLLFLDCGCRAVHTGWLKTLLSYALLPDVGCVTGRIYDEKRLLLHAAEVLGMYGRTAATPFAGFPSGLSGYMHKIALAQDCSVTGAGCLLISEKAFLRTGMDPERIEKSGWNTELGLRALDAGLRNIYTPYTVLEASGEHSEVPVLAEYGRAHGQERWARRLFEPDPYYNPCLSLERRGYRLKDNRKRNDKICRGEENGRGFNRNSEL